MAGSDTNVEVGITADDSGLAQTFGDAQQIVGQSSAAMSTAMEGMAADMEAASVQAQAALNVFGETTEQQTARLRAMVASSMEAAEANKVLGESELSLAERAGLRTAATEAQIAALNEQVAAQTAQMVSMREFVGAEAAVVAENAAVAESSAVAAAGITEVGIASSGATRELGVMAGEALRGNIGRLEQSTVTLANRAGILSQVFTPVGAIVAAIAGGLYLFGDAAYKSAEEMIHFNSIVEATGGSSAHTGTQLASLSDSIAKVAGGSEEAQKAVQALALSGRFVGDTLDEAAKGAAAFADLTGEKIEKAAEEFAKIGTDATKGLIELDARTHMVDSSMVALVATAQAQGNTFAATTLATHAMSDALQKADAEQQKFAANHSLWATWSMSVSDAASAEAGLGQTLVFDREKADEAAEAHKRLTQAQNIVSNAAQNSVNQIIEALTKEKEKLDEVTATYGKGKVGLAEYTIAKAEAAVKSIALTAAEQTFFQELQNGVSVFQAGRDAYNAYSTAVSGAQATLGKLEEGLLASARAADSAKSSHHDFTEEMKAEAEAAKGLADQQALLAKMAGETGDAYDKAWAQQQKDIDAAVDAYAKAASAVTTLGDAEKNLSDTLDLINQKYEKRVDILNNSLSVAMDNINRKHREEIDSLKGATQQQEIEKQYLQDLATFTKAWTDLKGKDVEVTDEWKNKIHDAAAETVMMRDSMKEAQEVMKGWENIAQTDMDNAFQAIDKDLIEGGNLMKDLSNVWKSVVEAILLQAEKLLIINPILNSIFGASGGSMLPTASLGSLFGGGGSSVGGGGGVGGIGGIGGMGGGFGGLGSTIGGIGTSIFGASSMGAGGAGAFAGAQAGASQAGMLGTTGVGQVLPVLGGVAAGIGEYSAAGGGMGGIAGAAAYGVGTYFATTAAATALSGGIAAGMAAIPVVGWIALAAMGINMLTGGGLFGTAWKATGGEQDLNIGPTGVSAEDQTFESRKRALFGGTAHKTITSDDAKAAASLQDFFDQLQTGLHSFATQFGQDTADVVAGSFKTTFDKHGKATGTSDTILGVTRTGETAEQFTQRIQADSFLAVLDKMGLGASKFVDGMQGDAAKLLSAVQDFAATAQVANLNITNGFKFMALGADNTLVSVMKFVEGLHQGSETLQQTYARLAQAQAQYNQFAGQFAPAASYVDPFEASVAQLRAQMEGAEAQANALAEAAGATGASLDDLDNIHRKYSADLQQLTAQLAANAQQLAFSLGLTTMGSLDQINAEINALEKGSTTASTSLSTFGNSVTSVAQKTNAALDLMLGNLSPLNDQQKLQYALQGLREGTVSADTVLGIGRNLYASSSAYNSLFNQVMPYAGNQQQGQAYYAPPTLTQQQQSTQSTLSPADQAKLDELKRQQAALEASQLLAQFQSLAQQVAEIAQAKGETVDEVLTQMGVKLSDLEKGLGITSDEDFNKYMEQIKGQTDSNGDNTRSIVTAIEQLPSKLAMILDMLARGQSPGATSDSGTTRGASTGTTRSIGSMAQGDFVDALTVALTNALAPITTAPTANASRNLRATNA